MPSTADPSRSEAKTQGLARDRRVAAVFDAVVRDSYAPLEASLREMADEALVRMVEDLQVQPDSRVLIVEPFSGYLPTVLAHLAGEVTVVCSHGGRSKRLAEQLRRAGAVDIRIAAYVEEASAEAVRYDRIVVLQPANDELGPVLQQRLSPRGRAVWSVDKAMPPRRMRRLLRVDGAPPLEEDLDLVHYMPMLGDMLVEAGVVLHQEVADAVHAAAERGRRLGEELVARGAVREDDLYRVLAMQRHLPFTQTAGILDRLDVQLVRRLPRKYLDHYQFLPICEEGGKVHVATPNVDLPVWELRAVFDGVDVVAELTTPTDVHRVWTAIELGFADRRARASAPDAAPPEEAAPPVQDSRAVGLFDAILLDAVGERASDVHLESYQDGSRLRFRVDGSLRDVGRYQLTDEDYTALLNVVKIAANLDIAERRAPQGGRVRRKVGSETLDLRVQTQPTLCHESVVIRILPRDRRPPTIEELGFGKVVAEQYRRLLHDPQGLVLVVGATGSGKSTTLYAGLQLLARDTSRKVITIEDPIEYSLSGVQQTQVNAAVGYRFADAVRAFVRQDPDVIMVGEVRDAETALEAIRAAQTGHLVLATMHCNDSVDAVQRLVDLGMQPNSIASELTAVLAQRLARRICSACRQPATPDPELLAELFAKGPPQGFRCFTGKGCDRCGGTGMRGRVVVVELLPVDAEIRRAVGRSVVLDDLRAYAHSSGMQTLRTSALRLVHAGVIPMAELYDVLSTEQMRPLA